METHAITSHVALPLLPRRPGGLVVETTDGTDDYNRDTYRVNLGHELGPRGATAVALAREPHFAISETPRCVGRAVAALAADPDMARINGQSLSSGHLARVYGFTGLDGSRPDGLRYLAEVQDAGRPAGVTGYR